MKTIFMLLVAVVMLASCTKKEDECKICTTYKIKGDLDISYSWEAVYKSDTTICNESIRNQYISDNKYTVWDNNSRKVECR